MNTIIISDQESMQNVWKKRILTWTLMLAVTLSVMIGTACGAMAATTKDASAFMDRWRGRQVTAYGGQCVALFDQYIKEVHGLNPNNYWVSYAYQIYDRSFPSGWKKIGASSITGYKVGDIVIYNPGNGRDVGSAGHVSLVCSVSNGRVKLLEQNWAGCSSAAVYDLHTARLRGIIRPPFNTACEHTYKISKVQKAPTVSESGSWIFYCSKCGAAGDRKIPALGTAGLRNGKYMLLSKCGTNKYVSVTPYQSRQEGNIALYGKGVADQVFTLQKKSNGSYLIGYGTHNLVFDVAGPDGRFGGTVWLWPAEGTGCQDWYFVPAGGGWYRITSRSTYYNMDVYCGKSADGTNIGTHYNNGADAQLFKPVLVSCASHSWDGGTVTKNATYTSAGEKKYTCTECGETKTEATPKLKRISIARTASSSGAAVTGITNKTWTGKAITQKPVVKLGNKILAAGTDYTVRYSMNINIGTAKMIIEGKGKYTGTISRTFMIIPKGTKIRSVTSPAAKKMKVTWAKQASRTSGYQIQYGRDRQFKKGTPMVTVGSNKTVSRTIGGLKSGAYIYVRIRTYKTVSGNKYCSSWSEVRKVRVR